MAQKIERATSLTYKKFGTTDMMVSEVCGGTMMWGSFNAEEQMAHDQLDAMLDLGVNFIDTAELYPVAFNYGKTTETWIGNWLEKRVSDGKLDRSKLYIASKCNPSGAGGSEENHGYGADAVMASCKASLERLKTSYLDLYYLHWPSRDCPVFGGATFTAPRPVKAYDKGTPKDFEAQVLAVKALLDAGLIKYWALSNENDFGVTMFCMTCDRLGVPRPVAMQNDYSLNNRLFETNCLEACHRFGIVSCHYGLLCGGTLSGKYSKTSGEKYAALDCGERPLKECRHQARTEFQPRYGWKGSMQAAEKYTALAEKYGLSPAELALAWGKQKDWVGAVIIGSTTVRQVQENVNAFKIKELPESLMKEIDVVHEEFRSPCLHWVDKQANIDAKWFGDSAYTAMES